eukprot:1179379-Prorocentrum_minimum.AAC.1
MSSLTAIKTNARARESEEKQKQERRRNLMVLVLSFLREQVSDSAELTDGMELDTGGGLPIAVSQ